MDELSAGSGCAHRLSTEVSLVEGWSLPGNLEDRAFGSPFCRGNGRYGTSFCGRMWQIAAGARNTGRAGCGKSRPAEVQKPSGPTGSTAEGMEGFGGGLLWLHRCPSAGVAGTMGPAGTVGLPGTFGARGTAGLVGTGAVGFAVAAVELAVLGVQLVLELLEPCRPRPGCGGGFRGCAGSPGRRRARRGGCRLTGAAAVARGRPIRNHRTAPTTGRTICTTIQAGLEMPLVSRASVRIRSTSP